ncbi:MAG: ABC transporter permease [Tissierellia bacterium]|nr:ABC transporter permease [Tissierellia bacterium]
MERTRQTTEFQKSPSIFQMFLKKLFRNKLAIIGCVIVAIMLFVAIFADFIRPYDPNEMNIVDSLLKPGEKGHLLGTDNYGRDVLSRLIDGTGISIIVGLGAVGVGGVIGVLLGLIAGFFGGWLDSLIMRLMDAMSAFPFILLAITLMMVFGSGLQNTIMAIGIANVPGFVRMTRGQVLSVKEEEYIEVTRSLGASKWRILFDHILPNCITPIIVYGTMSVAGAIISEAALSYLGLGIQPPQASWGNILQEGKDYLVIAPHIAVSSGLAIVVAVLGINLFGDALRDASDPRNID